jgi:hypothetical protein
LADPATPSSHVTWDAALAERQTWRRVGRRGLLASRQDGIPYPMTDNIVDNLGVKIVFLLVGGLK